MIYIQPLRKNDINPSMGKQYEFGKAFFSSFGWEGGTTHEITVNYKARTIKTSVKVRGDERGGDRVGADGKEYAIDGKLPLKNLLISGLGLNESHVGVVTLIFEALNDEGTNFNLYTVPERIPSSLPTLKLNEDLEHFPLQQIFYGAPGTGKSYHVDGKTTDENSIRTTFHPDSDYASFVGAYKPIMAEMPMKVVPVVLNNGASFNQNEGTYSEKRITYKFVPQAFLKAYCNAWKNLDEPYYLVIEEINRGNCAQVFGDLFQLLDRNEQGYSSYAIEADEDIRRFINEDGDEYKLSSLQIEDVWNDDHSKLIAKGEDIANGVKLVLPKNLHIWQL